MLAIAHLKSRPSRFVDGPMAMVDHRTTPALPTMPESQKPVSPQTSYSSESEVKGADAMSQPGAKRRPSRAGTRSVSTLTAAQLERKRANDREAQRAIRQRTKEHIENLERRIVELTTNPEDAGSKLMHISQRNEELEQENGMLREENAILRSRLGHSVGVYPGESEAIGNSSPSGRIGLVSQQRLSATPTRTAPGLAVSQPEHWQHHAALPATSTPTAAGPTSNVQAEQSQSAAGMAWAQHPQALPRPLGQPDASQHALHQVDPSQPGATSNYGYMVDSSGRAVQYQPAEQVSMPYEQPQHGHQTNPYQTSDYPGRSMGADVAQQAPAYPTYQGHHGYLPNAQMPQTQQAPRQSSQHMLYNVPHNLKPQQ